MSEGRMAEVTQRRGWIDAVGHREVPGRPELFATTRLFLDRKSVV